MYHNGNLYGGEFKQGLKNGYGEFTVINGDRYHCTDISRLNGFSMKSPNCVYRVICSTWVSFKILSSDRYKGYFLNGMRNGQGIEIFHNGERYIGEYAADKQNGRGTSYYANGNIKYMGTWLNGTPHG